MTDYRTYLAFATLASFAVNAFHWSGLRDKQFLYYPQSGWPRYALNVWIVAVAVTAVLFLARVIPEYAFLGVTVGVSLTQQFYSIAQRQQE